VQSSDFFAGSLVEITSSVVDWTPRPDVQGSDIFSDYNTRYARYLNTNDEVLIYPAEAAEVEQGGVYMIRDEFDITDPEGQLVTTDLDRVNEEDLDEGLLNGDCNPLQGPHSIAPGDERGSRTTSTLCIERFCLYALNLFPCRRRILCRSNTMKRRQFIQTVGIGTATASLAGCTDSDGTPDETTDEASGDDVDVSAIVVRNAPENPEPYENPVGTVAPQESDELTLDGFTFQRAGEKGLVVAGDATNTGDRPFQNVVVEITLHDRHETEDELLDSVSVQTSHERLDTGETWQWAVTFDDEQEFEIDYYVVRATASYA
jgi:hypothetical protein